MEGRGCFSTIGVPGLGFGFERALAAASVNDTEAAFWARSIALSTLAASNRSSESTGERRSWALDTALNRWGRWERYASRLAALVLARVTAVNRDWSIIAR